MQMQIKTLIVGLMVLTFANPAYAWNFGDKWTKTDTAYQLSYLAITTVDWAQTRWMTRQDWKWDGNNYKEMNPLFLDNKPHTDATWLIPAGMILHTVVALALPPEAKICGFKLNPRRIWQVIFIGGEIGAVVNNATAGVKIEF
jgi:hypothetical protein